MELGLGMNLTVDTFSVIFLTIVLGIATITDLRVHKIPNLLTFPAMAVALIYHCANRGLYGFSASAIGLVLGMAIFVIPYVMGGMGAGDAKLMGVVGAILGPEKLVVSSLFVAICGGIYALFIFSLNYKYTKYFINKTVFTIKHYILTRKIIKISSEYECKKPELYYAIPIVVGTLFALLTYHFELNVFYFI
jgi:prepilin peptidase CpaA